MPDKGKIMTQTNYEKQSKLIDLNQECYIRGDISYEEAVNSLKIAGFGQSMAEKMVVEWSELAGNYEGEKDTKKKQRMKSKKSLEKYFYRYRFGRKMPDESVDLE